MITANSGAASSDDDEMGQFAPSASLEGGIPRGDSKLLQRDRMIESLRLELAEAQIRTAEMEHIGDGRLQELERTLLETRMTNARLLEDNESFQLLLSEKTLKGDFMTELAPAEPGLGSLADELESAGDAADGESEAYRKLEAEVKTVRDGNKALTLYIDKIIGRLLQHEGFEHIIHERDEPPEVPAKPAATEKALPPAPAQSFLQRAKSVVAKPPVNKPMKPSNLPAPTTVNENPNTAPSIPLGRGHRRSRSDQAPSEAPAAAAVVGQMYRSSPLRTISGGPTSQGISPALSPNLGPTRGSYFPPGLLSGGRVPSGGGRSGEHGSSRNSVSSDQSGEVHSTDASSAAQTTHSGANAVPPAVMKQNQLRPLRLVREQAGIDEAEVARKANRGSWFGFFKGASLEAVPKPDE